MKAKLIDYYTHPSFHGFPDYTFPSTLSPMKINTAEVYKDASGDFRWRLKASNGRILADSGEGYRRRARASRMAEKLFPNAHIILK